MSTALLRQHVRPLEKYLRRPGLVEICINEPERVWLETREGWERHDDKALSLSALQDFASNLATVSGQEFGTDNPMLATALPDYGCRVQVCAGSVIDSGIAISIRAGLAQRFPLENYLKPDDCETLRDAMRRGRSVVVAGGTSSGKTTFLNSLIREIPDELRIVTIEDSKELVVDQPNVVRFLKSKSGTDVGRVSYEDIINACMRLRPDRILLGELDIRNTAAFLRLMNTGHAGGLSTVHADSPQAAIDAIVLNTELSGLSGPTEKYARQGLDLIVHLERRSRSEFVATLERIDG